MLGAIQFSSPCCWCISGWRMVLCIKSQLGLLLVKKYRRKIPLYSSITEQFSIRKLGSRMDLHLLKLIKCSGVKVKINSQSNSSPQRSWLLLVAFLRLGTICFKIVWSKSIFTSKAKNKKTPFTNVVWVLRGVCQQFKLLLLKCINVPYLDITVASWYGHLRHLWSLTDTAGSQIA